MNYKKRLEKLEFQVKLKADKKAVNCIILRGFQKDDGFSGTIYWHRYKENLQGTVFSNKEELEALIKENHKTADTMP